MQKFLETPWQRHLVVLCLLLILAAGVWWLYAFQPFAGLSPDAFGDSYDYAQIARNLWRGSWREGITTYQIPPLALSVSDHVPFLNVIRAPLHPIGLAVAFALFGPWDRSIAVYGGVLFFVSIPLLYLLGVRVFGSKLGLIATLVYILSDWVLKMTVSGLSEPLFIVLFLALLLVTYESARKPDSWLLPATAGVLTGLAYLTRYNTILFIPLIVVYLFFANRQRRWLRSGLFLVASIMIAAPWFVRNLILFGQPLFSMQKWAMIMATPTYPRFILWKVFPHPPVLTFIADHGTEMLAKIKDTVLAFYLYAPSDRSLTGGSPFTLILFVASLFRRLEKRQSAFRILVCAMFILQVMALLPLRYIPRLLFPFYPLFLLFGLELATSSVSMWIDRIQPADWRRWAQALFLAAGVVILTLPTLLNLPDALHQGFYPRLLPVQNLQTFGQAVLYIQEHTDADAVLISDAMDIVSWYADRATVWTPLSLEMLDLIEERVSIEGIYLTDRMLGWPEDAAWHEIFRSQPPTIFDGRYQLEIVFENGSLFYRHAQ